MGIPMGLQYSITAIGSVVLQTGINTLGSAAVASVSAASKLSMFLACPFDAIGSAMATYTGQNVGAGKIERIGQGLKASVLIGITYSILIFLVMLFSAKYWMLLFINASETEIIHNAVLFILQTADFTLHCFCQCGSLYHSGSGIQWSGNPCRCHGNDRKSHYRRDHGSVSGIRKRMFCQSSGMERRLFPDSGVLSWIQAEQRRAQGCAEENEFC